MKFSIAKFEHLCYRREYEKASRMLLELLNKIDQNYGVLMDVDTWAQSAEARDIMMYFGAAVDAGAVDQNAAADFLSQNSFIPACTAAYLPVGWFVDIVTRVEMATQQFMKTVHIEREGQQKRNAGFCAERFHSMLLQQYINQYGWDNVIATPMTMLTDDGARH